MKTDKLKIDKRTKIIISIAAGVFFLWFIGYCCVKAGTEKLLEKYVMKVPGVQNAEVRVYSDMFSMTGGNIRQLKLNATGGIGYCTITLKGIKFNAKDKEKSSVKSGSFSMKLPEAALAGLLSEHFKYPIRMQNGYVILTSDNANVTGYLTASGNMIFLRVTDSDNGISPVELEQKINPIYTVSNATLSQFTYSDGCYIISGDITGINK